MSKKNRKPQRTEKDVQRRAEEIGHEIAERLRRPTGTSGRHPISGRGLRIPDGDQDMNLRTERDS